MQKYIYECRLCGFKGESEEFRKSYFPSGSSGVAPFFWPPFPNFRCPKCNNHAVDSLVFVEAVKTP